MIARIFESMIGQRTNVVPFRCMECGAQFPEQSGGICGSCRRLLCRRHLRKTATGPMCQRCLDELK